MPDKTKTYRWALYILLILIGYWLGLAKAAKPSWFYYGPDKGKADMALISVLTEGQ